VVNLSRNQVVNFAGISTQGTFEDAQFVSEENAEYRLTQLRKISLTFRIINQQKIPLSQKDWTFGYAGGSPITLTSDENGEFRVRIPDIGYAYAISNSNNKLIYSGQSGQVDETIEIILDEDRVNTEAQTPEVPIISPSEDSILPFTLQYVEKGGRGIANMPFELDDGSSGKQNFVTDAEGKVLMPSLIANLNYRTKFRYSNRDLAFDFVNPSGSMGHKFLLREKIPWLWWLLCALLLALLLWCLLGTPCWCDLFRSSEQSEVVIPAINVQPCNQQIASGGAGITENVHELGNEPGLVILNYDMANVPDFLQIFYNGNVVTSTQEIGGNEDGFVGGNNAAGQSGQISFYYDAKGSSQCLVRVTGPDSTQWQYLLGCPQIGVLNNNTK